MSDEQKRTKSKDNKIFRKAALERLSSPDQLDTLMQITTPRAWLAMWVILAFLGGLVLWSVFGRLTESVDGIGFLTTTSTVASSESNVVSPVDGNLLSLNVVVGDSVVAGQVIAQISVADDANPLDVTVSADGEVIALLADAGNDVTAEQPLVIITNTPAEDADTTLQAIIYVPFIDAQDIEEGMEVRISPLSFPAQEYGFLLGEVLFVGQSIATDDYASVAFPNESVVQVVVSLEVDEDNPSGYEWTLGDGPDSDVRADSPVQVSIIVEETRPITRVFPVLGE